MKLIAIREVDYTLKWYSDKSDQVKGVAYFKTFFGKIIEIKFRTYGNPGVCERNCYINYLYRNDLFKSKEFLGYFYFSNEPKTLDYKDSELRHLLKVLDWMWRHPDGTKTHWVDPRYQDKLDKYLKVPDIVEEEKPETTGPFR